MQPSGYFVSPHLPFEAIFEFETPDEGYAW